MSEKSNGEKLAELKEGDLFELGDLMPGLNSGQKVVWACLENVAHNEVGTRRVTLHAYWHDVFLMAATVIVGIGGSFQQWRFGDQLKAA